MDRITPISKIALRSNEYLKMQLIMRRPNSLKFFISVHIILIIEINEKNLEYIGTRYLKTTSKQENK